MKKISKFDLLIFICLLVGIILTVAMFIVEAIVGTEVVLIRAFAATLWIIALVGGNYSVSRFMTPVERFLTREMKDKNYEEK